MVAQAGTTVKNKEAVACSIIIKVQVGRRGRQRDPENGQGGVAGVIS